MVARRKKLILWWRKGGIALKVTLFLLFALVITLFFYWQTLHEDSEYGTSSLMVFGLVNLNVVIICVLAFLVGRNVAKLVLDRRRNILGSKIKMRLVTAFVGLILVPTTILFVLASGLLTRALEGWFSTQVETTVNSAVEVGRFHFKTIKENARQLTHNLAELIEEQSSLDIEKLKPVLEAKRKEYQLFSLRVVGVEGELLEVHHAASAIDTFAEPALSEAALAKALGGEQEVLLEEREANQFVRTYQPLHLGSKHLALISTNRMDAELAEALNAVNDSYREYQQLRLFRSPIKSAYLLTLSMITGLILFAAIWISFYLAREIAVPIQRLAEGTRYVARGNYDFQIRVSGDDEIGFLVKSFNKMTADLKESRREGERRRLFIETILSNLAVGVIAIDLERYVTSINKAAASMLGLNEPQALIGRALHAALGPERSQSIEVLLNEIEGSDENDRVSIVGEREIRVSSGGRELKVVCSAGKIIDASGAWLGTVLLLDDVTELSKAQHMAVWREVAKRIAHEIKNPLTPIQLSAQRLERLLGNENLGNENAGAVVECTQTIVEHVNSIKRLANEFSHFARMPTAEFHSADLNLLISDTLAPYAENQPELVFQFIADSKLPEVYLDREQIRRVLINLVDNAVDVLKQEQSGYDALNPRRIVVKSAYDRKRKQVSFEVTDNGPGIKAQDKVRVFEPYFTTKKGGTGLGLAVVTSIVADHQGAINVHDISPHGTKFIVVLPIAPKVMTHRRLANA